MPKTVATVKGSKAARLCYLLRSGALEICDRETIDAFAIEGRIINTEGGKMLYAFVATHSVRTK
jgi:uncharacterized ParB-like nuclease family protein